MEGDLELRSTARVTLIARRAARFVRRIHVKN
jgi:hypothetical protein